MSETVRLTIPAKAEYLVLARLVLTGIAMEVPMSEIALADLKLAVTEVCGNAVQHAYEENPGVVRLVFRVESEAIEVSVEDEGAGAAFPTSTTTRCYAMAPPKAAWASRSSEP